MLMQMLMSGAIEHVDDKKKFDGTADTVTDEMREACPLTTSARRQLDFRLDTLELYGPKAAPIFGRQVDVKVAVRRGVELSVNTTSHFKDGTALWLNFVRARPDSPAFVLNKGELYEAEDNAAEVFVKSGLALFLDGTWSDKYDKCRMIGVLEIYGKFTAWAKIAGNRPTIRIVRNTLAAAVQSLHQELETLFALDEQAVGVGKAARRHADERVAQFESARRAGGGGVAAASERDRKADAERLEKLMEEVE